MTLFVIRKHAGPIALEDWDRVIESTSYLEKKSDRSGVNPFTQQPMHFSGKGKALFLAGGRPVGNISLQEGKLLTVGVPKAICAEIALKLGARVYPDDDRL